MDAGIRLMRPLFPSPPGWNINKNFRIPRKTEARLNFEPGRDTRQTLVARAPTLDAERISRVPDGRSARKLALTATFSFVEALQVWPVAETPVICR